MNSRVLIHILGWLTFIVYKELEDFLEGEMEFDDYMLVVSLHTTRILVFYFFYSFIWSKYLIQNKWIPLALGVTTGIMAFIGIRYFLEEVFYLKIFGFHNYWDPALSFYIKDNFWMGFSIMVGSVLVFLFEGNNKAEKNRLLLEQEKIAAELAFLRSQVNPHFLFNTLSFLHTEAFQKNPELAETILKVSDILRYSVVSTKAGKKRIGQEITLIKDYIDIFQKRFANRCFVNFTITGDGLEQLIEPLLLIPFVENAFKHGQFSNPNQPITVDLQTAKGSLVFRVFNHKKQQNKDKSSGIGIENVNRRLALLYAKQHELAISDTPENFQVSLSLQL